jgi:DNA replication protein DnaC
MGLYLGIRESYRDDGPREHEAIERFLAPRLLVIDEAHERGETAWEDRMLNYIVDTRYADMRDTVLISNQTAEDFRTAIGSSIYSRLTEVGGILVCDWPSYRSKT